jgi:hypothetical protein
MYKCVTTQVDSSLTDLYTGFWSPSHVDLCCFKVSVFVPLKWRHQMLSCFGFSTYRHISCMCSPLVIWPKSSVFFYPVFRLQIHCRSHQLLLNNQYNLEMWLSRNWKCNALRKNGESRNWKVSGCKLQWKMFILKNNNFKVKCLVLVSKQCYKGKIMFIDNKYLRFI